MKIIALVALAALAMGAGTMSANAADITYTGSQSARGLTASYTITTDGALGDVQAGDIVGFDVRLTNNLDTFSFDQSSPGASYSNANLLDYTPTIIYVNPNGGLASLLGPNDNGLIAFVGSTELQIVTDKTTQNETATSGNIFETAVSAAPEPSAWLLMMAGIGGIGLRLRRVKKGIGSGLSVT